MHKAVILSEKGQITIPKAVRVQLGLVKGTVLVFHSRGSELVARKVSSVIRGARWRGRGKLPVGETVNSYLRLVRDGHCD